MSSTKLDNGKSDYAFKVWLVWFLFGSTSGMLLIPVTLRVYGIPIITLVVQFTCYAIGQLFQKYEGDH